MFAFILCAAHCRYGSALALAPTDPWVSRGCPGYDVISTHLIPLIAVSYSLGGQPPVHPPCSVTYTVSDSLCITNTIPGGWNFLSAYLVRIFLWQKEALTLRCNSQMEAEWVTGISKHLVILYTPETLL